MTDRYLVLKSDEKKIYETFTSQFSGFINELEVVLKKFNDNYDCEKLFEEELEYDRKNIVIVNDIVDECIWLIQKNEPRANHLRFFISVINSCNHLKRTSAYIVNFAKFYRKQNKHINKKYKSEISELFKVTIKYLKIMFGYFKNFPVKINESEYSQTFDMFLKEYKKLSSQIVSDTIKLEKKLDPDFISAVVIVVKNFDRYLDLTLYIIDNFTNF